MDLKFARLPQKLPQLPHRLRCTEVVSPEFARALHQAIDAVPHALKQGRQGFVDRHCIARPTGSRSYKTPLACAELYRERFGALAHLEESTVARLAVDVFLDELAVWRTRIDTPSVRGAYQAADPAPLIAAGFAPVNGKQAGELFYLTEEEAQRFERCLIGFKRRGAPVAVTSDPSIGRPSTTLTAHFVF